MYLSRCGSLLLVTAIYLPATATETRGGIIPIWNSSELNSTLRAQPDGSHYQLMNDIYLNETEFTPWTPLGDSNRPFNGTLDGRGRVVYGLKVNTTSDNAPIGLFGLIVDSWIHHLILSNPSVSSSGSNSPAGTLVGMMKHSRISDCTTSQVQVRTSGSPAGGLVGYAHDGTVSNSLTTGEVRTDGDDAYGGGMVGYAYDNCPVSNSLAVVEVRSFAANTSTGGLVGFANNSPVSNSLAIGNVNLEGDGAHAGGLVGYANNSRVSNSVAAGNVGVTGAGACVGGLVGRADNNSPVSNSLATGDVTATRNNVRTGGMVGYAHNESPVSDNLATGRVNVTGQAVHIGGLVGYAFEGCPVNRSLATGHVNAVGDESLAGGLVGFARTGSPVSNSLATGDVDAYAKSKWVNAGGLVGAISNDSQLSNSLAAGSVRTAGGGHAGGLVGHYMESPFVNNSLGIGTVTATGGGDAGGVYGYSSALPPDPAGTLFIDGRVFEPEGSPDTPFYQYIRITEKNLRNGTNGLDETLWNPGTPAQFPIPIAINPAYQELKRLNSTTLGREGFPEILENFASPGNVTFSIFDPMYWSVHNPGLAPIPKAVRAAYQELKRLDERLNSTIQYPEVLDRFIEPVPSSSQRIAATKETLSSMNAPTESPAVTCPSPAGSPVFQTRDPTNGLLYVVYQKILGADFTLARYRGTKLDSAFGECGVQEFTPKGLERGFDITAGTLLYRNSAPHLYLTVSAYPQAALMELLPGRKSATLKLHWTQADTGQRFNTMMADSSGTLVAAGVVIDREGRAGTDETIALVGEFAGTDMQGLFDSGWARDVSLLEDNVYILVVGMEDDRVFLRRYDRQTRTLDTSFGSGTGKQTVMTKVTPHSQQAVLVHREWVYVASNNDSDQQLLIHRLYPETGEPDNHFAVHEATPGFFRNAERYRHILQQPSRRARVVLMANDGYLHVLKYGQNGQIFAATYNTDEQGQSHYRLVESLNFSDVADYGLAAANGRVFLAFERGDNSTMHIETDIHEVPLPGLSVNRGIQAASSNGSERWGCGVTATVAAIASMTSVSTVGGAALFLLRKMYLNGRSQPMAPNTTAVSRNSRL